MLCRAGDVFVKPELRQGILPRILAGLLKARAATRAELKKTSEPTQQAVLDSRQKALKVCHWHLARRAHCADAFSNSRSWKLIAYVELLNLALDLPTGHASIGRSVVLNRTSGSEAAASITICYWNNAH